MEDEYQGPERRSKTPVVQAIEDKVTPTLNGVERRAKQTHAIALALIPVLVVLIGAMYQAGQTVGDIGGKLDRNCRVLVALQANTRFIIVAMSDHGSEANAFRRIFEGTAIETCG